MRARILASLFCIAAFPFAAHAIDPSEILSDPTLEARARAISSQLRCLVCQNESIDESEAALAKDLRTIVRQRLAAGDTDQQVKDFLVARYGNFILLKPPFDSETILLWSIPIICLGAGGLAAFVAARNARRAPPPDGAPLSAEEHSALASLVGDVGEERRAGDA